MANEITASVNATISQTGQSVAGTSSFQADVNASGFIGDEQTIPTTAAQLVVVGTPTVVFIKNLDTTNFVTIDGDSAQDKFPQKLLPGRAILLLPETGTIYAKADTAPCRVWVVAG